MNSKDTHIEDLQNSFSVCRLWIDDEKRSYKRWFFNYTERNNLGYLQYERLLNLRIDFKCSLHDFTCMLLSATVKDVESIVQDGETKVNMWI